MVKYGIAKNFPTTFYFLKEEKKVKEDIYKKNKQKIWRVDSYVI